MILELLEYLATPASRLARSMGFLKSALQVRARFLRCRQPWRPHLEHTRALILQAASLCPTRRKAVLFGAGLLHDIPLKELSALFQEVVLVDIVHPLSSRFAAWRQGNVRQVSLDVTGVMDKIFAAQKQPGAPLPISFPEAFCTDSDLDLSVSVNLLSQLAWVSSQHLATTHPAPVLDTFYRHLLEAHLDYLQRLPGHTALITDSRWTRHSVDGAFSETWDVLHGVTLPTLAQQWTWAIAPAPEREAGYDFTANVVGYPDWKQTSRTEHA